MTTTTDTPTDLRCAACGHPVYSSRGQKPAPGLARAKRVGCSSCNPDAPCSADGCDDGAETLGMCRKHYTQYNRRLRADLTRQIEARTTKTTRPQPEPVAAPEPEPAPAPRPLPPGESWRLAAACLDTDSEVFFPNDKDTRGNRAALRICGGCGVREQCAALAAENETAWNAHGVFGGMTADQRRSLYRAQARKRREAREGAA